jgi:hypothetical protein
MASIHKDILLDAHPNDVWAAVRDFGSPHQRLVAGFVLDARLDGDARIVTFNNGTVARELLVDCDDEGRSQLIWIVDVLPNEIAPYIDAQMDQAALAMQKALGRNAA